jgi:predicted dehydrogenase
MLKQPTLRVGIVGTGYWGSKHVRTMSAVAQVEQVSVIDPRADRTASLLRHHPALACFATLDDALDSVDAVVIATPPRTHAPLALAAIEAGKHVMVEKPLATSVADAAAIVDAARSRGVVAMVGHTFEYHAGVWALRDIVSRGDLGEVYYLDSARLNMGLYQHDANVVWDLAPHDISILNYVTGSRPSSVECWGSRHAHPGLEDIAHLRLVYDRPGVEANIHVSWLHPNKTRRVTVVGSDKMAVFDDLATEERIRVHDKCVRQPERLLDDPTQPPMSYRYGDVVSPYVVVNEPLSVEDQHFVDCILSGERPRTDGENGLAVVEVLEAAQTALQERRLVRIDEVRAGRRDRVSVDEPHPLRSPVLAGAATNGSGAGDLLTAPVVQPAVVPAQRASAGPVR